MAKRREDSHWLIFTDLTAGLLALFILAFVAMTTMKEKKAEALTRTEQEVVSCQEEMRRVAGNGDQLRSRRRELSNVVFHFREGRNKTFSGYKIGSVRR